MVVETIFADKAAQLKAQGYTQYYDRDRQNSTIKCSRCNKTFGIESFTRGGEYKHYAVCVFCGAWICLDDENEYYYPPISFQRQKTQEQIDNDRMFHYAHGLWLSSSYNDFKNFLLAYTVVEIKAKSGKKPENLTDADVRAIARNASEAEIDKFFRQFYRHKPAPRDKQKWTADLLKATKMDLNTLEFLKSRGITDFEKWYYDTKFPTPAKVAATRSTVEQIDLFNDMKGAG